MLWFCLLKFHDRCRMVVQWKCIWPFLWIPKELKPERHGGRRSGRTSTSPVSLGCGDSAGCCKALNVLWPTSNTLFCVSIAAPDPSFHQTDMLSKSCYIKRFLPCITVLEIFLSRQLRGHKWDPNLFLQGFIQIYWSKATASSQQNWQGKISGVILHPSETEWHFFGVGLLSLDSPWRKHTSEDIDNLRQRIWGRFIPVQGFYDCNFFPFLSALRFSQNTYCQTRLACLG